MTQEELDEVAALIFENAELKAANCNAKKILKSIEGISHKASKLIKERAMEAIAELDKVVP